MSSDEPRRRGAGRPVKRVLSQARIVAAALEVIQAGGYGALTMSALARRLEVAPSALYNHVESKQEVLRWLQDFVMSSVDTSCFADLPWDQALRAWARSYRDVFARHTPLIPVIAVLQVSGAPRTLAMYEAVTQGLQRAGWPTPQIVPAIVALESFIYGSAYDAVAPQDIFDTGALAADSPRFTAAVELQTGRADGRAADAAFEAGLSALVTGLAGGAGLPLESGPA
ncbi:TetR/AcrR family transcriptional regulator [Arthrobacter jiangjiafuii]|uniref:TetR/AcrR family transcriptional regulator n=1 Tax=Arthrobacter jiangjiafuii TaxID=2817475 RepID=A0A975M4U0_9MICC|nr:TetR/AcrR family transcriptional regulator C-terminal domain-containing protein [Arthrobacter jiangjiafuii]MBP3042667.1 TetR/AcrR family transcriptional regulator C-terminal domain-containing protein [Arthrobacter jiangjiafuii]QWC09609.1 TetR/AcrR family transcriptional regulator [Arthrobacter jiangjiafuii]